MGWVTWPMGKWHTTDRWPSTCCGIHIPRGHTIASIKPRGLTRDEICKRCVPPSPRDQALKRSVRNIAPTLKSLRRQTPPERPVKKRPLPLPKKTKRRIHFDLED